MIKKIALIIILSLGFIACSQNFYNKRLMKAIVNDDIKQVSSILKKQKADINHISEEFSYSHYSHTPLTLASIGGYEIVKLLIEHGADINAKNNNGWTALMWALVSNNAEYLEIIKLLVENGANINTKNNNGDTALIIASRYTWRLKAVKYLVGNGADINAKNNNNETSLMHASYNGHLELVKYLVENGAYINEKDNESNTALSWAKEESFMKGEEEKNEIIKILMEAGAK